jgi:tetratricopeptide (TPR) repeat protein
MARLTQRLGLSRFEADEHYKDALKHYNNRSVDEAILAMDEAIKLLPSNAEYYAARGFFYMQDGINDKASADFDRALEIYPYEMLAHYGRGVIAYRGKKWDEAVNHFIQAQRIDQQRPETLYYLALAYHRKGNNELALSYMQQADSRFDTLGSKTSKRNTERWMRSLTRLIENS